MWTAPNKFKPQATPLFLLFSPIFPDVILIRPKLKRSERRVSLRMQQQQRTVIQALSCLLFLLFISSTFSTEDNFCEWRFHNCIRESARSACLVQLKKWCACDLNATCATNDTVEVSDDKTSSSLLAKFGESCHVSSCTVVPSLCEWTPWKLYMDICLVKRWDRVRESCCHPVYRTLPVNHSWNATCSERKRQREVRSKFTSNDECNRSNTGIRLKPNPGSRDPKVPFVQSFWKKYELLLCGLLLLLFIPCFAAAEKWRRRRRGVASRGGRSGRRSPPIVIDLSDRENALVPKNAMIPQPGQPLSEAQRLC